MYMFISVFIVYRPRDLFVYVLYTDPENPEETLEFAVVEPFKAIKSKDDLERFKQSKSYGLIKDFVLALNDSCKGKVCVYVCVCVCVTR